ncbi:MAG: phosphatase PAP2 family protein [Deltaproteobacteria bacterium]|nr:phosphatase PAP2 family protein [Deltaproteobacteria bacterium]
MKEPYDQRFHLEEIATIAMLAALDGLILLSPHRGEATVFFLINIVIAAVIIATRYAGGYVESKSFILYRDFSVLLFLIIIYMEHYTLIPLINPHDVDSLLFALDRFIFAGHDPTIMLERVTYPVFTEILQIIYISFYFLPLTLCVFLYLKGCKPKFHIAASTLLIGFYVSYVGYYLAPALGPRYFITDLQNFPLEGVFIYQFLRDILDAAAGMTRDCYPSGHALISVLTVFLAWKYLKSFMMTALVWTLLLLISAIYLRYHYVVDVIAGMLLAVAVYGLVPAVGRYVEGTDFVTQRGLHKKVPRINGGTG